jgi:hypothetical protein
MLILPVFPASLEGRVVNAAKYLLHIALKCDIVTAISRNGRRSKTYLCVMVSLGQNVANRMLFTFRSTLFDNTL